VTKKFIKLHRLRFKGLRKRVFHWYLETSQSVLFIGGAETFRHSEIKKETKEYLEKRIKESLDHEELDLTHLLSEEELPEDVNIPDYRLVEMVDDYFRTHDPKKQEVIGKKLSKKSDWLTAMFVA